MINFKRAILEPKNEIKGSIPADLPLPVSARDVDALCNEAQAICLPMELQMADPCPVCKGHCMVVGDYVSWGFCYRCYQAAHEPAGEV